MPTLRTVPLMDVVPAPRRPAEDAAAPRPSRPQRPADQYWNVFEACWCLAKASVKAAAGIN